jgi:hypothetical protein
MAIVQISQIQNRRGLQQDLPQLASGEIGWSVDARKLYIGNGTLDEGAPAEGHTEILTEFSIVNFTEGVLANVDAISSNVSILQSNIVVIDSEILALQSGIFTSNSVSLTAGTSGNIAGIPASNAIIYYTALQGTTLRTGTITMARYGTTISSDDEYTTTGSTNLALTMTANSTHGSLNYSTTSATSFTYRISVQ